MKDKHPPRPFNPNLANVFFRAGMIEVWGRGIARTLEACRAAGIPESELREEADRLWVEFRFLKRLTTQETAQETTQKTTQETTQKILKFLRSKPHASRREIANALGDITVDGVKYHLEKLKESRSIRPVGPDREGFWEVLK